MVLASLAGCRGAAVMGGAEGYVPGGARVRVLRLAEPPRSRERFAGWGGAGQMTGGTRRWWDPAGKAYGGYELHIEPLGNGQFNVLVQGLGSAMAGFHRMGLPAAIPPLVLRVGERIEIDLFREAPYRLFDRVEVER